MVHPAWQARIIHVEGAWARMMAPRLAATSFVFGLLGVRLEIAGGVAGLKHLSTSVVFYRCDTP